MPATLDLKINLNNFALFGEMYLLPYLPISNIRLYVNTGQRQLGENSLALKLLKRCKVSASKWRRRMALNGSPNYK